MAIVLSEGAKPFFHLSTPFKMGWLYDNRKSIDMCTIANG